MALAGMLMGHAVAMDAQTGTGNPAFLRRAEIRIFRDSNDNKRVCLRLSSAEVEVVRRLVMNALNANAADERAAKSLGGATGGIYGFSNTHPYALQFQLGTDVETAYLHVFPEEGATPSEAWISGTGRVGNIVLSRRQALRVLEILRRAKAGSCRDGAA